MCLPPDAKRPSRVSPSQKSMILCRTVKVVSCLKNVTMSKSLEELAREGARVQGQSAGKEEDDGTSDESGPMPVSKSTPVVSDSRHHRWRMLIDHLMCRDGELEQLLLERGAVKTLDARRIYQTAVGTFLKCGDAEIDGALVAYSKNCFAHGVLRHHRSQLRAAVMGLWPSFSRSGPRKLPTFHQCLKSWRQLTLVRTQQAVPAPAWERIAAQHPPLKHLHMAVIIFILPVPYICTSELLAFKKKDLVPPLAILLPCSSVVIAASEAGVSTKTRVRDGSVLVKQRWLRWVNEFLAMFQTCHSGASIDRVRAFRTLQQVRIAFSSVARYDMGSCLAADHRSLHLTLREHSRDVPRNCWSDCESISSQT